MQKSLCAVCSGQLPNNKWLPRPINSYRNDILSRYDGSPIEPEGELYPIFSNVAYNLQYLEYLNKCFEDLYTTSVIRAENVKMFALNASQIIECILYVKLIDMGVDKQDIWDFNGTLRNATQKNPFGMGQLFYREDMRWLKDLRNRIHIQSPAEITEADYVVFSELEVLNRSKELLRTFLQKALQMPSSEMDEVFYYLLSTTDFVHSKEAGE